MVVGHRGLRGAPEGENTLAAFERALADGARAVEIDVRLCATGEVVVFHDPDLKRATNGADARAVREVAYPELAAMHLFQGSQGVPLLRDVLSLVARHGAGINVEMKHDDIASPAALARAVSAELARGSFDALVSSFDPRLLARIKSRAPRTRIALLTTTDRRWLLPLGRLAARLHGLYAVHLERTQVAERVVRDLETSGVCVGAWTVNDPAEARAMLQLGVDWIITDKPGLLASRGAACV